MVGEGALKKVNLGVRSILDFQNLSQIASGRKKTSEENTLMVGRPKNVIFKIFALFWPKSTAFCSVAQRNLLEFANKNNSN
jgi:hypothetical protein